jgi:prevent-host-death family protein
MEEISKICHENTQPVYITKHGRGNLVILSRALYEHQQALLEKGRRKIRFD